jgi:ornithine carbamoyltransferase
VALVLSRYCDAIMARTFSHGILDDLGRFATVPVINGLSDEEHPCQVLADLLTIQERLGRLAGVRVAYVGDGNNVANSWMLAAARMGMDLRLACPRGYEPSEEFTARASAMAAESGATITVTNDSRKGCDSADVVYTDVWASMGQESQREARVAAFDGFQVNGALMSMAAEGALVMHCLPAHYGEEIDYETSRGGGSVIFDQAENRLHAHKAVLAAVMGG